MADKKNTKKQPSHRIPKPEMSRVDSWTNDGYGLNVDKSLTPEQKKLVDEINAKNAKTPAKKKTK